MLVFFAFFRRVHMFKCVANEVVAEDKHETGWKKNTCEKSIARQVVYTSCHHNYLSTLTWTSTRGKLFASWFRAFSLPNTHRERATKKTLIYNSILLIDNCAKYIGGAIRNILSRTKKMLHFDGSTLILIARVRSYPITIRSLFFYRSLKFSSFSKRKNLLTFHLFRSLQKDKAMQTVKQNVQ